MKPIDRNEQRNMVFYGRVSTEQEAQLSALKNQMQWYDDQLKFYPNWNCIEKYIDEGITGTQAKKRPSFLRMIEDAKKGKFDLIVTREVSRFARNTLETLQFTRDLKYQYGVEVFFIEDNIWTMDGDGELRLTIMATLAQEESRKTSERVKAGIKISRDNGVLYGTGNVLGYDRAGDTYVINEEQAETVRIIFKMYTEGKSSSEIRDKLCELGRLTSQGKKVWYSSVIIKILKNPIYKGVMRYGQSYNNNYLEQKRKFNYNVDEIEYKKGNFPPIISENMWDEVQKIMQSKTKPSQKGRKVGNKGTKNIWMRKLQCKCGGSMGKNRWRVAKDGTPVYGYFCIKQKNIGSAEKRAKLGLDTEGYCDIPMVADWKLEFMAKEIISSIWQFRKESVERAYEMVLSCFTDESEGIDNQIKEYNNAVEMNQRKINNLIEMRMNEEITKEEFAAMRKKYDEKIIELKEKLDELTDNSSNQSSKSELNKQLEEIRAALNEVIDFSKPKLDDYIIDRFVDKIIPLGDNKFQWYINLMGNVYQDEELNKQAQTDIIIGVDGRKNQQKLVDKEGNEISLSFEYNRGWGDSRKKAIQIEHIIFGFEQVKAWKKQVGGRLSRNGWIQDIEVDLYLVA